ncbi:hypothetical protein T12_11289 [Trichinella patagoniensis]|uniref:Uncharacterized protein n=1 Tax=Trichinella patagoniensis TaxID=990121 RepID=A0A0V1A8P7_9BILA|nr:hypothetical protein T12_11289 [Trichinella patagoniensis]
MAGSFFFQWKINGRKRHRNQLSLGEMSNVDKWSVQVERPLQLSVSDGLVKKRARLLALWFCCVTSVRCSARFFSLPNFCYRHHYNQHQAILSRATSVLILKFVENDPSLQLDNRWPSDGDNTGHNANGKVQPVMTEASVGRCNCNTTKPAVGGVWSIRMETYSEKRLCILIGPLATAMNAKVRLAPAVLFACSTCAGLVRRSLPSPTQWDIVDIGFLL